MTILLLGRIQFSISTEFSKNEYCPNAIFEYLPNIVTVYCPNNRSISFATWVVWFIPIFIRYKYPIFFVHRVSLRFPIISTYLQMHLRSIHTAYYIHVDSGFVFIGRDHNTIFKLFVLKYNNQGLGAMFMLSILFILLLIVNK